MIPNTHSLTRYCERHWWGRDFFNVAPRNKVKEEKRLDIYGGLREDIGMKTYLHDPMDYAKKMKLRFCVGDLGFCVGDLDLPERRDLPVVGRRTWLQICARVARQ